MSPIPVGLPEYGYIKRSRSRIKAIQDIYVVLHEFLKMKMYWARPRVLKLYYSLHSRLGMILRSYCTVFTCVVKRERLPIRESAGRVIEMSTSLKK